MRFYRSLAPSVVLFTIESSVAFAPPPRASHNLIASASSRSRESLARLNSESGRGGSSSNNPTVDKGERMGMETDESATEYEYNEADFADYVSDYSSDASAAADDDDNDLDDDDDDDDDLDDDGVGGGDGSVLLAGYDDYSTIGGFDLTPFEKHAREVFMAYALQVRSAIDHESDDLATSANEDCEETRAENAAIMKKDLFEMLQALDIDASLEESEALFKYLDADDDGTVTLEEFLPWYAEAIDSAQQTAIGFQNLVKSRRTIHKFDATEVDDGVLRRALECAIAAPNRRGTEPWRFIKLGKETVSRVVKLREEIDGSAGSFVSWTRVPHWIVVAYPRAEPGSGPDGKMQQREDFKSTCCAVQNFLLSMWSEGIGTKWTDGPIQRTAEFARICGIDLEREKVAGVIWYGFAKGGLNRGKEVKWRRKGVEEVLDILP